MRGQLLNDLRFFVCRSFQALFSCCGFKDYLDLAVLYFLKVLIFTRLIIKGIKFVLQRHCKFASCCDFTNDSGFQFHW